MKINWKVRIKIKAFWLAIVPAMLLLIQGIAAVFGFDIDLGDLGNKIIDVINAGFVVLSILGVVNDPTTVGIRDSERAMNYEKPN